MSTLATLGGCTAVLAGLCAVPLAVAAVASPINRSRDGRRNAAETARIEQETGSLVGQIRAGANYVAAVEQEPVALAEAAHRVATALADHLGQAAELFMSRAVLKIGDILADHNTEPPARRLVALAPLGMATALQLLLRRLEQVHPRPDHNLYRASAAAGCVAQAMRVIPGWEAIDDGRPLTEFDPAPLHHARAAWLEAIAAAQITRQTATTGTP